MLWNILTYLALCLLGLSLLNLGIWIRLNTFGKFSVKTTKIIMIITSIIFILGAIYYYLFRCNL